MTCRSRLRHSCRSYAPSLARTSFSPARRWLGRGQGHLRMGSRPMGSFDARGSTPGCLLFGSHRCTAGSKLVVLSSIPYVGGVIVYSHGYLFLLLFVFVFIPTVDRRGSETSPKYESENPLSRAHKSSMTRSSYHKTALDLNFDPCKATLSALLLNHCPIPPTNPSTSLNVFPECRQTLTLCVPFGTVGGTIGRTRNPSSWQNFARLRGSGVRSEKMGDCGFCWGTRSRGIRTPLCSTVGTSNDRSWS